MSVAARGAPSDAVAQSATIGSMIISAISRFAPKAAIADDHRSWTYAELGAAIARVVAALKLLGVRRGASLAMLVGNRLEQVACQYAAVLMGVRYTALHPLSAPDTHAFVLDDAEITVLVVEPALLGANVPFWRAASRLPQVLSLGALEGAVDLLALMAAAEPEQLADEADPTSVAYLLYTGGTTGLPKGVMLSHRAIVAATTIQAAEWDLPNGEVRFLAATPTTHASGIVVPTVLMRGGFVRLTSGFQPDAFCEIVRREAINMCFLVPTMIYVLLDHPGLSVADLGGLETIMYGAAPMSPDRLAAAIAALGPVFVQLYGQTEAPMVVSTLRKVDHDVRRRDRIGSCGLPSASVQVKLFDADMAEVAVGTPGEVCVRGPIVMDGYWKRPEATEEAFRGGWLHTGDVAVRDANGFLTLVDRTNDLIISGGFNVYPREVEDALLAHAAVASAAVVGVPDEKWGEAVTAYVVLRPGEREDALALVAHVRALKGPICAPKAVHFVDAIPLTGLGKVDRKALRGALATGTYEPRVRTSE